jgi:hypothetical protein
VDECKPLDAGGSDGEDSEDGFFDRFQDGPASVDGDAGGAPAYEEQAALFAADFKGLPWAVTAFFAPTPDLFEAAAKSAGIEVLSGEVHPRDRGHLWEPSNLVARWLPRLEARMGAAWGAQGVLAGAPITLEALKASAAEVEAGVEAGAGASAGGAKAEAGAGAGAGKGGGGGGGSGGDGGGGGGERESFLSEAAEAKRPLCVDLGCGAGRDAVWAALRGWQVLALDSDAKGLARVTALAARHGVVGPHGECSPRRHNFL